MQQPYTNSDQETPSTTTLEVTVLPRRALLGVVGLLLLTLGSLGLAWVMPDSTLLHFLWVAQAVPVLYLLLVWLGTHRGLPDDDPN